MEDNNYECLFNVEELKAKSKIGTVSKSPMKSSENKITTNKNDGTSSNFTPMDYFSSNGTSPKVAIKSNPAISNTGTQPIQSSYTSTQNPPSNSFQTKLSNDGVLTKEQIDQVEKVFPNGKRTSLYMYYYNYYSKVRPGRNKEYYDNLIDQYIKICKERLSRIEDEKHSADHSRRLLKLSTEVVVGPKITKFDDLSGCLFYWFGINKLDRVIKWYDTILDKDQNDFNKIEFTCYRRNAILRKNWNYVPNEGFKYISTSFEAHSVVMATINQNSFLSFARICGYRAAPKKIFLEYVTSS